nr:MAG: hypothetical protein DIU55_01440 [Bacillota bacterium]
MATTEDALPGLPRVGLRPVEQADLALLSRWDEDSVIGALMGRRFARLSPAEWWEGVRRSRSCRVWMIEWEGRSVGEVELAQLNRRAGTAEVRICVGEKALWGRGIGTAAMSALLDEAFGPMGLESVYLRVFSTNRRAIALYEKLGFRPEGLLAPSRRRSDPAPVLLMSLTRGRWLARSRAGRGVG